MHLYHPICSGKTLFLSTVLSSCANGFEVCHTLFGFSCSVLVLVLRLACLYPTHRLCFGMFWSPTIYKYPFQNTS